MPEEQPDGAGREGHQVRVMAFPVTWATVGAVGVVATCAAAVAVGGVGVDDDLTGTGLAIVGAAARVWAAVVAAVVVYVLVMTRIAAREVPELMRRGALREYLLGLPLGVTTAVLPAVLLSLAEGVPVGLTLDNLWWVLTGYDVVVVLWLALVLPGPALVSECLLRGLLQQAAERVGGRVLGVTAPVVLVGGLAYLVGLDPVAAVLVGALQLVLGVLFLWRRRLWATVGASTPPLAVLACVGPDLYRRAAMPPADVVVTTGPSSASRIDVLSAPGVGLLVLALIVLVVVVARRRGRQVER